MKNYKGTKIAVIIGIILSTLILAFYFIYPITYAKPRLESIREKAEQGIDLASEEDFDGLTECIKRMSEIFGEASDHLKLFYNNHAINDAVKDINFALNLVENQIFEKQIIIECLSNIISDVNYIFEGDALLWSTFF
ncbi:MAG: hypothetical protein GX802_00480 [Clostridiales bacterium]|jgi:hypothetical protein|nr:hypothetical protein [Clostridiales bacterium]